MPNRNIPDHAPATRMFPAYSDLYRLIEREVDGLTDEQLDFTSDRWGWSEWSIRMQLSHMASLLYRWLLLRWVDVLFPDGHDVEDVRGLADSPSDRRLDDKVYSDYGVIMAKLREGIDLTRSVLRAHDVGFLRRNSIPYGVGGQWTLMAKAHPAGIVQHADGGGSLTLEATIRHMYFEEITHLYNIQRLKRAQGLPLVVNVPRIGYWVLDEWDRSEPSE